MGRDTSRRTGRRWTDCTSLPPWWPWWTSRGSRTLAGSSVHSPQSSIHHPASSTLTISTIKGRYSHERSCMTSNYQHHMLFQVSAGHLHRVHIYKITVISVWLVLPCFQRLPCCRIMPERNELQKTGPAAFDSSSLHPTTLMTKHWHTTMTRTVLFPQWSYTFLGKYIIYGPAPQETQHTSSHALCCSP